MWKTKTPKIEELHKLIYTMESICEFMGQVKQDIPIEEKPNFTTKDYKLHQFQCYIWRKIDELSYNKKSF